MFHKVHVTPAVAVVVMVVAGALVPGAAHAQATADRPAVRDTAAELGCAAKAAFTTPAPTLKVSGGREKGKGLFGMGDAIVLTGGTAQGLQVGQQYYVRRIVRDRFTAVSSDGQQPVSIHTAGWVRIVDAQTDTAVATVTYACDGILEGDYLEAFDPPAAPPSAPLTTEADYSNPGRVILGDERRQMGAAGSLMVVNRGSDHGLRGGQRLTIFREAGGGPVLRVGEATVMIVGPETSTFRIDRSTDAVHVGDLIAVHR